MRKKTAQRAGAGYRALVFGPVLPAGGLAWSGLGEPFRGLGLLAFLALALALVPVVMLAVLTAPAALLAAAAPKDWRRWWRKHDWRTGFTRPKKHPGPPGARLQRMVRAADRNRCVSCKVTAAEVQAAAVMVARDRRRPVTQATLQIDHFFPWVLGGPRSFWNFFLLCPRCNQIKSSYWKYRESGREVYSRHADPRHIAAARDILAAERRARWSLPRCWRAAWALR